MAESQPQRYVPEHRLAGWQANNASDIKLSNRNVQITEYSANEGKNYIVPKTEQFRDISRQQCFILK